MMGAPSPAAEPGDEWLRVARRLGVPVHIGCKAVITALWPSIGQVYRSSFFKGSGTAGDCGALPVAGLACAGVLPAASPRWRCRALSCGCWLACMSHHVFSWVL